jgi:hypothetical protein
MKRMRQKGISRERRMLRDFDFHICCHKNEKLYFTVPHRKVSRKKISSMHSFLKRGSIDAPWTPARDLGSVIHRHCHCLLRLWFGIFVVLFSEKHNSNSTRKSYGNENIKSFFYEICHCYGYHGAKKVTIRSGINYSFKIFEW